MAKNCDFTLFSPKMRMTSKLRQNNAVIILTYKSYSGQGDEAKAE